MVVVVEEWDKVLVEMLCFFIIEGKFRLGSNFRNEDVWRKFEVSFVNEVEIVFIIVFSSGWKIFF